MSKKSSLKISDDIPAVTQADIDRAKFRINLKEVPRKKRINIMLDTGVLAFLSIKRVAEVIRLLLTKRLRELFIKRSWKPLFDAFYVKNCRKRQGENRSVPHKINFTPSCIQKITSRGSYILAACGQLSGAFER